MNNDILDSAYHRMLNAHHSMAADDYREGVSDRVVKKHYDEFKEAERVYLALRSAQFANAAIPQPAPAPPAASLPSTAEGVEALHTALTEIDSICSGALNNAFPEDAPDTLAQVGGIAARALKFCRMESSNTTDSLSRGKNIGVLTDGPASQSVAAPSLSADAKPDAGAASEGTPRADAAMQYVKTHMGVGFEGVHIDFARQLERELIAAQRPADTAKPNQPGAVEVLLAEANRRADAAEKAYAAFKTAAYEQFQRDLDSWHKLQLMLEANKAAKPSDESAASEVWPKVTDCWACGGNYLCEKTDLGPVCSKQCSDRLFQTVQQPAPSVQAAEGAGDEGTSK